MDVSKIIKNIVLIVLLSLAYSIPHEVSHYEIYEHYGCEDIDMGITKTTAYCGNIDDKSYYEQQHMTSLNEIVNYNLSVPIFILLYFYIKKNMNI